MTFGTWVAAIALQGAGGWVEASVPSELASVEARSVEVTSDGIVWFGVRDRGLARYDGVEIQWVTDSDGLASNGVADLMEDGSGALWVVGFGGYAVLRDGRWEASSAVGSMSPRVVFGASHDPRTGAVWVAGTGGAGRLLGGEWTVFDSDDGLPHAVVHAALSDAEGTVWFACRTGLARLRSGALEVLYPTTNVRSIVEAPGGTLWFGTSDGVLSWDGRAWTHELGGRTVLPRLVASDGAIWAGSAGDGVFRLQDGEWTAVEIPTRFGEAEIFDLAEGGDGSIWIATAVGVLRLREGG